MSKSEDFPSPRRFGRYAARRSEFTPHLYDYVEHGGTAHSATCLGVDEHVVIKTIVLEDERKRR